MKQKKIKNHPMMKKIMQIPPMTTSTTITMQGYNVVS
jgi:hypothetical protein